MCGRVNDLRSVDEVTKVLSPVIIGSMQYGNEEFFARLVAEACSELELFVCTCIVRVYMYCLCIHVLFVCTCIVCVYMYCLCVHVLFVCTCIVHVYMYCLCVHVLFVCTCIVRVYMYCSCVHVLFVCTCIVCVYMYMYDVLLELVS